MATVIDKLRDGKRAAICCLDDGQRAGGDPGFFAADNRPLTHNVRMAVLLPLAVSWLCQFPAAWPGWVLLDLPGLRCLRSPRVPARRSRERPSKGGVAEKGPASRGDGVGYILHIPSIYPGIKNKLYSYRG